MNRRQIIAGGAALALTGAGAAVLSWRSMGSMADYNAAVSSTRALLAERPELHDFIRFATLAASGHNTQPWRFRIGDGEIAVLPDFSRRTPVVDPDDHHLYVSLGCAAENLAVAAAAQGRGGELRFDPDGRGAWRYSIGTGQAASTALFDAIPNRQSTRTEYDSRPVGAGELKMLAEAAAIPGVDVVLVNERQRIDRVRDLIVAGNSAQIADPGFMQELKAWLRFSPRHAADTGDGLFSAASGSPALPEWLGPHLFDLVFRARTENEKYVRQLNSSAGVAVFVAEKADAEHWVLVGRACQRFALQATALGLRHCFVNQPVEVASLRPELASLAGLPGRRPDLVMRFGYGPMLPFSARRPVSATLA